MDLLIKEQIAKAGRNGDNTTVSASMHDTTMEPNNAGMKAIAKVERALLDYVKIGAAAYGGGLGLTGVIIPVVASITMAGIYLTHPVGIDASSNWFPLLSSTIITAILWLFAAFCCSFLTTAQAANSGSYGMLSSRLCQLKANLDIEDADNEFDALEEKLGDVRAAVKKVKALQRSGAANVDNNYNHIALIDAYTSYIDISKTLHRSPAGLLWTLGTGYITSWRLLHHAEEALIEALPVEEVIRGAIHDKLAIQGSTINRKDELLDKLLQAVSTLQPAAAVYFKEHQPDKGDTALNQLTEAFKRKAIKKLMDENDLNDTQSSTDPKQATLLARATLREVRSTLNDFRDKSWEGIVRARNRLLGSIAVTGIVTHVLLSVAILTSNTPQAIMAATAFYLVGAITGLFGRFYRESVSGAAVDDFGFSTARLVATPLLCGLAGVGGVMLTVMLAAIGNTVGNAEPPHILLNDIFRTDPRLFFAAAIFGLTPNLLIKGLQDKANKFETDIQSSKAAEPDAVSSSN